jgi:PAS domain S-box-containing protein
LAEFKKKFDELQQENANLIEENNKLKFAIEKEINDCMIAQEDYRISSLYARNLIEASLDSLVTISADGKITDVNKATENITGVPSETLIGSDFADYFTEPEVARIGYQNVLKIGKVTDYPLSIKHKDGHITDVLYNATVYRDQNGSILGVFAAARDITEQKKSEARIKGISDIIENSLNEVYIIDPETMNFIYANKGAIFNLGYTLNELILLSPIDIKPEFTKETYLNKIAPVLDGSIELLKFETFHKRKNFTLYPVEINLQLSDYEGKKALTQIILDISTRKEMEFELRESEEKLSALFSSMTDMVVIHELIYNEFQDPIDYTIIDCNLAFTEITGLKKEDVIYKKASAVYNQNPPPYLNIYSKVAITSIPYKYETFFEPMDKYFSISVISPKKNQFATVTSDITSIKKFEEALSTKNQELENYLFVASHDLRSPLVNIQGFSQRLLKKLNLIYNLIDLKELDEKVIQILESDIPKALDYIFTNVKKMDTLLEGLLQISRTGRIQMKIKSIDMDKLLNNIKVANEFQLSEVNAKLVIKDLPNCFGDEDLLNQVFSNLITNAIKYRHPERNLLIEITAKQQFKKYIYCISDNGLGIAEKHLPKIWNVFYRVDNSKVSGEGLGLSIVKRIMDKHQGKVWVESNEGIGSIFYIELQLNEFFE